MELYDVFRNQVLKHPQVCQAFIGELETKPYTEVKFLFLSSQGEVDKIMSKQKCAATERKAGLGYVEELRRQEELVDLREKRNAKGEWEYNARVISWVIYYGHHQILEYIVQQVQQHHEIRELFGMTENIPHQSKSGTSISNEVNCESNIHTGQPKSKISKRNKGKIYRTCGRKKKVKKSGMSASDNQGSDQLSESGTSTCEKHEDEYKRLREENRLLFLSCYSGDVHTFRVLLPHVCKETISGGHALTAACEKGHMSMVEELMKAGADVNIEGNFLNTPLIAACEGGHVTIVKELVKAGADVNLQSRLQTPLILACKGGHMSVVKELVKAGANVNIQDMWGNTPLISACEGGHLGVVEDLVKIGADINLQVGGITPLIAAVKDSSLSTVKCLVDHGADVVTQVNDFSKSIVYIALMLNKPHVVKYLILEQNKSSPGKFIGNAQLFNCLVEIRHAGVTTDCGDDVVVKGRSVWWLDMWEDMFCTKRGVDVLQTIRLGHCDVLRHLLCLGLDVNLMKELCCMDFDSDFMGFDTAIKPLLFILIDEFVRYKTEKVRILLEAGADVNARVMYREYRSVLDRKGVSVLERTRRLVSQYSKNCEDKASEFKRVMCEIKKHLRRHSV
jgi:ankyrin repeat protein